MSTADYSHIPSEFKPTEGVHDNASQGKDAKAGDGAFCNAVTAYICRYRDMTPEHRESLLKLLEIEAARRRFMDLRGFIDREAAARESRN